MNRLSGHIAEIEESGSLSLVLVKVSETIKLKTIVIETPKTASYLGIGKPINLLFKETEVVICTDKNPSISLQNRLDGIVSRVEKGTLISKIYVQTEVGEIISIISTNAVKQLGLQARTEVTAMVKLNEIMLSQ